jgi:molybdenum cofactor biosynthesis protein B
MVDFQSRDTRRSVEDEDNGDDPASETTTDHENSEETPGADGQATVEEPNDAETAQYPETFTYAVVTVATDRTIEEDTVGTTVVDAIEGTGDTVVTRELLAPDYDGIQQSLAALVDRRDVQAVVTLGGEGVEPDDVTVDAASDLFETELPGFGELFRVLSHDHDGTAVVRTRATAGIVGDVPIFCLPDDSVAARRGVEQIVATEAPDIAEFAAESDDA